jgi:primosomal protein N' (replication factor Y)
MVQLKISSNNALKAKTFAGNVAKVLKAVIDKDKKQNNMLQILGPIEAPIKRISSKFRWQILVKSTSSKSINEMITSMMDHPKINPASGVRLIVDVDPYSLM